MHTCGGGDAEEARVVGRIGNIGQVGFRQVQEPDSQARFRFHGAGFGKIGFRQFRLRQIRLRQFPRVQRRRLASGGEGQVRVLLELEGRVVRHFAACPTSADLLRRNSGLSPLAVPHLPPDFHVHSFVSDGIRSRRRLDPRPILRRRATRQQVRVICRRPILIPYILYKKNQEEKPKPRPFYIKLKSPKSFSQ